CNCQTPRPMSIARPSRVAMPGKSSFLRADNADTETRSAGGTPAKDLSALGDPSRLRPMLVLLGDEKALERAEQAERQPDHQRDPQDCVDPIGRGERELDEESEPDDDEAD